MPIHLGEDNKGHYYEWGNETKYYFNTPEEEKKAYNKAMKQMKAIYSSGYKGGIIIDDELGGKLFPEIRKNFPPYVRQIINEFGDFDIKDITICRNPLNSNITKLLNIISFGQVNKQMRKMSYDNLFHLFMLIHLSNGRVLLFEKNEVINMYVVAKTIKIDSFLTVNMNNQQIKLKDFINNAVQKVGPSIYLYNHLTGNCQHFITNLLKYNGLLTNDLSNFINQDVQSILSTSPNYVNKIAKLTTDFHAWINRLVYGAKMLDQVV